MRITGVAVAAALSFGFTSSARADDKADIQALYKKVVAAFKAKDVKAIMAMGTPDFTMKERGVTMNAKQSEAEIKQEFAMTRTLKKIVMNPDQIEVKGKNATVFSSFASEAVILDATGAFGPKGKTHVMAGTGKMREMLVKTSKGWKFKSIETLSDNMTIDGKPMQMGAPPKKK